MKNITNSKVRKLAVLKNMSASENMRSLMPRAIRNGRRSLNNGVSMDGN
jgi:hypothetical protein